MRLASIVLLLLLVALMAGPAASQGMETAEPDSVELAALTPEELFLRASSSALQFQHMIEPSRRVLVREHESSIPYLVAQLDTDDVRERNALEDILVRIGSPAAAPVIAAFLVEAERTDTTRGARLAATVLGRIGEPSAVGPLASAREHPDWKVRGAIGGALGRIGVAESVLPLVSLLEDGNEAVRKSAAVGLRHVATRAGDIDAPDARAAEALSSDVVASLVRALADGNYAVRYSAADALARIGEPALESLLEVSGSGTMEARLMALRAVGAVGSRKTLKLLVRALNDPSWTVRAYAASAIGAIGPDKRCRRALERLVADDPHPFVVASAAAALDPENH
jgi:HEAT repeat protein